MRGGAETVADKIDEMVRRIVERFDPDQIILFGSHARETARPDSDIDLLVVMPVMGSKREKQIEVRCALHDIHVAKDIVVVTPDELERRRNIVGTIIRPALREGKVLYVTGRLQTAAAGTIPRPTTSRPADHYNRMIRCPCRLRPMTSGT